MCNTCLSTSQKAISSRFYLFGVFFLRRAFSYLWTRSLSQQQRVSKTCTPFFRESFARCFHNQQNFWLKIELTSRTDIIIVKTIIEIDAPWSLKIDLQLFTSWVIQKKMTYIQNKNVNRWVQILFQPNSKESPWNGHVNRLSACVHPVHLNISVCVNKP